MLADFIFTPAQVRELDRIAIEELGIPGYTLMSRAGATTFAVARERFPDARRWLVICGAGNNAGDGYVVARLAREAGLEVRVAALSDPQRLRGDAGRAWADFRAGDGGVVQFSKGLCDEADLIVDAMLGTGLDRPLEGVYLYAAEALAAAARPVVAVDIPSGLSGQTGQVLGAAVRASLTVTFVGRKRGLYLSEGPLHAGDIVFDDLQIPDAALERIEPDIALVGSAQVRALLPARPATAHKGLFGHVLIVGGNHGMAGAVRLAGEAALRGGAGLVTVATRPANVAAVIAGRPELMARGVESGDELQVMLDRATVIALGPGLGTDDWARAMFAKVLDAPQPKVLDADALNLLAGAPRRDDRWILTPHPGEAGRLLGRSGAAVQADRLAAAAELVERYGGVALLKGHGTLVAQSGRRLWLVDAGNPAMATAGMGDVLTGLTAALLAQAPGCPHDAAAVAAFAHAVAGDRAAAGRARGVLASDLFPELPRCLTPSN